MANLYQDITLPFKYGNLLKFNCYYTYTKNRKSHTHILYLTYQIEEFPENFVDLASFMSEYVENFTILLSLLIIFIS